MNQYAFYQCPIGLLKIGYTEDAIFMVQIVEKEDFLNKPSILSNEAFLQIQEYLSGTRKIFTLKLALRGTIFQLKVWKAIQNIPYGTTLTYKEIATKIHSIKACRAVGMACHQNPLLIVIPCHRVIGSNQQLVGYAGGLSTKQYLLTLEEKNTILKKR